MKKYTSKRLIIFCILVASTLSAVTRIHHHYMWLELTPGTHLLTGRDKLEVTTTDKFWEFQLSESLQVLDVKIRNKSRGFDILPVEENDDDGMNRIRIIRKLFENADQIVDISYQGTLYESTGDVEFSREKIAFEISATISDEGVFLSPSGGYYPQADEELAYFDTVIRLPITWEAVSEGTLVSSTHNDDYTEVTFQTEHPMDGINLTASQWVVTSKIVDGVQFYTYFFEEDSSLASEYLDMSIEYVKMYSDMLSPYPFTKFAVVENFFPTGYGMPSYTVLGRSVVRLPFIVYTSLGHEVLHNWWGNSVYVGDGGNWCEGLTTYQADYLYKMQSSESAARQYRKDILKDYTVYVNDKNDFPPSEFVSRWDDASRAIGYGKVAMIFHMLEQQLGTDAFITALQSVIANFQFKKATWDDFIAAFESAGNTDLSDFKTQWIESTGAPELRIMEKRDGLVLEQSKEVRPITVDVTSIDNSGVQTSSTLTSNSSETNIPIKFDDQLAEVRIDKDFHVMRRLHPQEMDPTIRETLSKDDYVFIVPEMTPEWKEIARSYHGYLSDSQTLDIRANVSDIEEGKTPIYLGILPKPLNYLRSNGEINVYGNSIDADTHSLVWAFKDKDDEPGLVIYSGEARELIPVARKLPHYGKYGYLVFSQGENRKKGYHQTLESPLVWRK